MAASIKARIHRLLGKIQHGSLTVSYWDGEELNYGTGNSSTRIVFHKPMPQGLNMLDPMLAFGEAYMDEVFDIEGSWENLMRVVLGNKEVFYKAKGSGSASSLRRTAADLAFKARQKQNIFHHYDLGNEFFALWLDETMSYSCAYFQTAQDTLYQAQIQKIDHILRKLQLKKGESLLDIGSGWGWLIIRAAQQYGVKATGITLSEAQYQETTKRIHDLGLQDRVQVRLEDYLDLDPQAMKFDRIVSVGMFEHVGKANMPRYMQKVEQLLVPGGISMLHTISGIREGGINSWSDKYIFPGGYVPSLREVVSLFPEYDFHLLHAESLRLHYARTLDHWYKNFAARIDEVEKMFDRRFVRMWSLYLLTCAAQFRSTGLDIYQLLFTKGLQNDLPLTWPNHQLTI